MKDKLFKALYSEDEASKILLEFGFKWWLFGFGCGVIVGFFLMR